MLYLFPVNFRSLNRRYLLALTFLFATPLLLILALHFPEHRVISGSAGKEYRNSLPLIATMLFADLALCTSIYFFATARPGLARLFALLPLFLAGVLTLGLSRAASEHVIIGPTAFVLPARGFFNIHHTLPYANIATVMLQSSGKQIIFYEKDGTTMIIPLGDLVNTALPNICGTLQSHSISVIYD